MKSPSPFYLWICAPAPSCKHSLERPSNKPCNSNGRSKPSFSPVVKEPILNLTGLYSIGWVSRAPLPSYRRVGDIDLAAQDDIPPNSRQSQTRSLGNLLLSNSNVIADFQMTYGCCARAIGRNFNQVGRISIPENPTRRHFGKNDCVLNPRPADRKNLRLID